MKGKLILQEVQSFKGTWMWYLIIGITIVTIGGSLIGAMMSGKQEGLIGVAIAAIATVGVMVLLATLKLHTSIDDRAIYYRFPPFVGKEKIIRREDVQEMYVRKYRALWEYGGYGYRFRFRSGRALIVGGKVGLQLVLKNGKKILIGTQKAELMETAVRRLRENWEMDG